MACEGRMEVSRDARRMSDIENAEQGIVERIDPLTVPAGILSVHEVRYRFAAPRCRGRKVLDIACGAGYGSVILAAEAESVIGGDIEEQAVEFARRNYSSPNLRFERMDALAIPIPDASVDAVVSFETIEHVPDAGAFLGEVARILQPGGVFIVSTPVVPVTNHAPRNPHHVVEFSLADFGALLRARFESVELYGQSRVQSTAHRLIQRLDVFGIRHRVPTMLRKKATQALATVPYEDMGVQNQRIALGDFANAHDVVAVCSSPRGRAA